jgi:hypothetical protein
MKMVIKTLTFRLELEVCKSQLLLSFTLDPVKSQGMNEWKEKVGGRRESRGKSSERYYF